MFGGERLTQPGGVLLAGAGPPARLPGVGEKDHGTHHAVGQGVGVAVGVVGLRAQHARALGDVLDERDRAVVAAEGGAGQRQAPGGVAERLLDPVAPALGVPAVVNLVEDHQRPPVLGAHPVAHRVARHLGVGHHHAVVVLRGHRRGVGEPGVQRDARGGGGLRPLGLEVLGGHHHGDPLHGAVREQFSRYPQGEGGLAGAGRRHQQEVAGPGGQVADQRSPLPASQCLGAGRIHSPHPYLRRVKGSPEQRSDSNRPRGEVGDGRDRRVHRRRTLLALAGAEC